MKPNRDGVEMLSFFEQMMFQKHIAQKKCEYMTFMGGITLPPISLRPLAIEELRQNLAWATVMYDPHKNNYELQVFDHIHDPSVVISSDYLLYHEFTHALDISLYGAGDVNKYNALRGYLEYHAAQVEMMKLVGTPEYAAPVTFSMCDTITDIEGKKSVLEYVEQGIEVVTSAMERPGFRTDLPMVFHAVGALYNHLGRLSLCQMSSTDFDTYTAKLTEKCPGVELFGQDTWALITSKFVGIMEPSVIQTSGQIYFGSLIELFDRYGLQP